MMWIENVICSYICSIYYVGRDIDRQTVNVLHVYYEKVFSYRLPESGKYLPAELGRAWFAQLCRALF